MCFELDSLAADPADLGRRSRARGPRHSRPPTDAVRRLRRDAGRARRHGVVVLPDVRGLYRFYEELALRFAERGYTAIAIDYFGRTAGVGKRDDDFPYMDHVAQTTPDGDPGRHRAQRSRGSSRARRAASIFTVGFCFGGRNSWLAAAGGHGLAGAIGFYGGPGDRDGGPGPASAPPSIDAPILALQAGDDANIPAEENERFDEALTGRRSRARGRHLRGRAAQLLRPDVRASTRMPRPTRGRACSRSSVPAQAVDQRGRALGADRSRITRPAVDAVERRRPVLAAVVRGFDEAAGGTVVLRGRVVRSSSSRPSRTNRTLEADGAVGRVDHPLLLDAAVGPDRRPAAHSPEGACAKKRLLPSPYRSPVRRGQRCRRATPRSGCGARTHLGRGHVPAAEPELERVGHAVRLRTGWGGGGNRDRVAGRCGTPIGPWVNDRGRGEADCALLRP